MTELEAKQLIVDVVGAPWTVEDIELRPNSHSHGWVMEADGGSVFVDNDDIEDGDCDSVERHVLIGKLVASALEREAELPYDRVLREKEAAWAEEKAELEGKIEELEEALRIT
jgi:hypothetical protein